MDKLNILRRVSKVKGIKDTLDAKIFKEMSKEDLHEMYERLQIMLRTQHTIKELEVLLQLDAQRAAKEALEANPEVDSVTL